MVGVVIVMGGGWWVRNAFGEAEREGGRGCMWWVLVGVLVGVSVSV